MVHLYDKSLMPRAKLHQKLSRFHSQVLKIVGALKMRDVKMQDMKTKSQIARGENSTCHCDVLHFHVLLFGSSLPYLAFSPLAIVMVCDFNVLHFRSTQNCAYKRWSVSHQNVVPWRGNNAMA